MPNAKLKPKAQGRILVRDASSPGLPAWGGRPAIAPGYREATEREAWVWYQSTAITCAGRMPTADDLAELGAWYDQHIAEADQHVAQTDQHVAGQSAHPERIAA